MRLFSVIILCCFAEEELGPRGKNKWKNKNKKPKADGPEFVESAGVPATIHFKYPGQDFDVTEGKTFNNLTFLVKDSTGTFIVATSLVDANGLPFRLEIKAFAGVNSTEVSSSVLGGSVLCEFNAVISGECDIQGMFILPGVWHTLVNPKLRVMITSPVVNMLPSIELSSSSSPALVVNEIVTTTPTTTSTTTTTTIKRTKTTREYPKEMPCRIKKGKKIDCAKSNMHNAEWMIQHLMDIRETGRNKVQSLDLSNNPNLATNTIISILKQLPNLKSLKMRGIGFEFGQLPEKFFAGTTYLKTLDISENSLACVRGALTNLHALKKLSYGGNPNLVDRTGRSKCKKKKCATDIGIFDKFPRDECWGYSHFADHLNTHVDGADDTGMQNFLNGGNPGGNVGGNPDIIGHNGR